MKYANSPIKVSILIPFYGNRYYQLKRSLPFLLNQSYDNYEILLLDDGKQRDEDRSQAYNQFWGLMTCAELADN